MDHIKTKLIGSQTIGDYIIASLTTTTLFIISTSIIHDVFVPFFVDNTLGIFGQKDLQKVKINNMPVGNVIYTFIQLLIVILIMILIP